MAVQPVTAIRLARQVIAARSNGRCEACGVARGQEASHRVARGMGGAGTRGRDSSDCPVNLTWICTPCHRWVEANPARAYERGMKVRRGYDPAVTPVLVHTPYGFGAEWVLLGDDGTYTPSGPLVRADGLGTNTTTV